MRKPLRQGGHCAAEAGRRRPSGRWCWRKADAASKRCRCFRACRRVRRRSSGRRAARRGCWARHRSSRSIFCLRWRARNAARRRGSFWRAGRISTASFPTPIPAFSIRSPFCRTGGTQLRNYWSFTVRTWWRRRHGRSRSSDARRKLPPSCKSSAGKIRTILPSSGSRASERQPSSRALRSASRTAVFRSSFARSGCTA